ncbi:unnamed protein product [Closterium sp. NIES-53]
MEVARTSMIHAIAPHFLWPFAVRYVAHQLNLCPCVSLPETSPTLRWTGKVGDASMFWVWGSRDFFRDTSADKLSSRAIPCVFLGFPLDTPGWQFFHPTSRRALPSHVEPLPKTVPVEVAIDSGAARGTASGGAASGGAEPASAEPGGAEPAGAEPRGAEFEGAEPVGPEREGVEPGGAKSEGAESGGAEPRGTASSGSLAGASPRLSPRPEPFSLQQLHEWFAQRTRLRTCTALLALLITPHFGYGGGAGVPAGAGGTGGAGAASPGGAHTRGTGAAGAGGVGGARAGDPGAGGARAGGNAVGGIGAGGAGAGGARAGDLRAGGTGAGGTGAGGAGAGGAGPGGAGAGGTQVGGTGAGCGGAGCAGFVDPGAGGAGAGVAASGSSGARGTVQRRPFFVPPPLSSLPPPDSVLRQVLSPPSSTGLPPSLLSPPPRHSHPQLQPNSPLPAPSPYGEQTDSFTERCELESCPASPVCTACTSCRVPRPRPPPVPGTHVMALRPSSVPLRVPLPPPPESSLPAFPDPESDLARASISTVSRLLSTIVTDPSFKSAAASALVAEMAS